MTKYLVALLLVLTAATGFAQDTQPATAAGAPPATTSSGASASTETALPCSIRGVVRGDDGNPITPGVVTIRKDLDHSFRISSAIGGQESNKGTYTFADVPCESLTLRVERPGYEEYEVKLKGTNGLVHDVTLARQVNGWIIWGGTVVLLIMFGFSLMLVRWHNIARVNQELLKAEAQSTTLAITLEVPEPPQKILLEEVTSLMEPFTKRSTWLARLLDMLFWTRGAELAAWARLRDVQRQMVLTWDDQKVERIRARLSSVEQQLRTFKNDPSAVAIADQIATALKDAKPDAARWKQTLAVGLQALNSRSEEDFAVMTGWQTKGTWLATVGLVLIAATVYAKPAWAVLFLMGAVGGLLSRLGRALKSDTTPSDYGASWMTLFLSPISGALSGWFGYLLALGFVDMGVLNSKLADLLTCANQTGGSCDGGGVNVLPLTAWALAFILGFSERLFEKLATTIDQTVVPGSTPVGPVSGGQTPAPTTTPAPVAAPAMPAQPQTPTIESAAATGTTLEVVGTGLTEASVPRTNISITGPAQSAITIDPALITYDSDTKLTITLPAGLTVGDYTLKVTTQAGLDLATPFKVS